MVGASDVAALEKFKVILRNRIMAHDVKAVIRGD